MSVPTQEPGLRDHATVVVSLEVITFDAAGQVLRRRACDPGTVEMPAYFFSGTPGDEIGRAAHKALHDLMRQAASDVRADLLTGGNPA